MTSKECLKLICDNCHRHIQLQKSNGFLPHKECPFLHISNEFCPEFMQVYNDLELLEKIKKEIKKNDK